MYTWWYVAQLSGGFTCYSKMEEVWDLLFLDSDGSTMKYRPFCLCTSACLWLEDSLSLNNSPLAARTCSCLHIPDSSVCPALSPFTSIHSSTLTLSPMQAREALPLHPCFSWLQPCISCFCAISTFQLKLLISSVFQSHLPPCPDVQRTGLKARDNSLLLVLS